MECRGTGYKDRDLKVELKINGKGIELNPFVKTMIYSCVLGLLKPLKGAGDIKDVSLRLSGD